MYIHDYAITVLHWRANLNIPSGLLDLLKGESFIDFGWSIVLIMGTLSPLPSYISFVSDTIGTDVTWAPPVTKLHSSNLFFFHYFVLLRVMMGAGVFPAVIEWETWYSLERLLVHHRATHGQKQTNNDKYLLRLLWTI